MPRSNKDRVQQVGRWLRDKYELKDPLDIRLCHKIAVEYSDDYFVKRTGDDGYIYHEGGAWVIRLSTGCGRTLYQLIHNLIHEYAHAYASERGSTGHDRKWGYWHSVIYEAYYDDDGAAESRVY